MGVFGCMVGWESVECHFEHTFVLSMVQIIRHKTFLHCLMALFHESAWHCNGGKSTASLCQRQLMHLPVHCHPWLPWNESLPGSGRTGWKGSDLTWFNTVLRGWGFVSCAFVSPGRPSEKKWFHCSQRPLLGAGRAFHVCTAGQQFCNHFALPCIFLPDNSTVLLRCNSHCSTFDKIVMLGKRHPSSFQFSDFFLVPRKPGSNTQAGAKSPRSLAGSWNLQRQLGRMFGS